MQTKAARAIRRFCLDCQGRHAPSVAACTDADCLLHPFRAAAVPGADEKAPHATDADEAEQAPDSLRLLRVIRRSCLQCVGNRQDVRRCDAKDDCALWSYRFGVLPATFRRVTARRRKWRESPLLPGLR